MTSLKDKLTEAQKRAILTGEAEGRGKWPLRNALAAMGLASTMPFRLTSAGLALRSLLKGEGE